MDSPSDVEFPLTPEPDAGDIWRLTDILSKSSSAEDGLTDGNSEDWISLKEAISDTFSRVDRLMNVFAHVRFVFILSLVEIELNDLNSLPLQSFTIPNLSI
jgi:hypothetical protein